MLTEGNKYLAQIVIRGIKGNFKPILGWYQEVSANSKRLTNLVEAETPQSTTAKMALNTLKPGFYSKNPDVAYWACKLFAKIAHNKGDMREMEKSIVKSAEFNRRKSKKVHIPILK